MKTMATFALQESDSPWKSESSGVQLRPPVQQMAVSTHTREGSACQAKQRAFCMEQPTFRAQKQSLRA